MAYMPGADRYRCRYSHNRTLQSDPVDSGYSSSFPTLAAADEEDPAGPRCEFYFQRYCRLALDCGLWATTVVPCTLFDKRSGIVAIASFLVVVYSACRAGVAGSLGETVLALKRKS